MKILRGLGLCAVLAGSWFFAGCESDDLPDHTPPPGRGSLIVDNRTSSRLDVFLDGRNLGSVGDFDAQAFDLLPGVRRIVLDPDSSFLNAAAVDADILEGRRTVLEADMRGSGSDGLILSVFLD